MVSSQQRFIASSRVTSIRLAQTGAKIFASWCQDRLTGGWAPAVRAAQPSEERIRTVKTLPCPLRIHSLGSAKYLSMSLASTCKIELIVVNSWDIQGKAALQCRYPHKQNTAGRAALPFCCLRCDVKNCSSLQIQQVKKEPISSHGFRWGIRYCSAHLSIAQ